MQPCSLFYDYSFAQQCKTSSVILNVITEAYFHYFQICFQSVSKLKYFTVSSIKFFIVQIPIP